MLYSRKLLREKTFTNFAVLEPSAKGFLHEIWVCPYQPMIGFNIPRKFSPRNGHLLPIRESFLPVPQKFPAIQYDSTILTMYYNGTYDPI